MYGNGCFKCNMLENRLKEASIKFDKISDMDKIIEIATHNSLQEMPILSVDDKIMGYNNAIEWLTEREN